VLFADLRAFPAVWMYSFSYRPPSDRSRHLRPHARHHVLFCYLSRSSRHPPLLRPSSLVFVSFVQPLRRITSRYHVNSSLSTTHLFIDLSTVSFLLIVETYEYPVSPYYTVITNDNVDCISCVFAGVRTFCPKILLLKPPTHSTSVVTKARNLLRPCAHRLIHGPRASIPSSSC